MSTAHKRSNYARLVIGRLQVRISAAPRSTQPSIPPGSVNDYRLWLGRQRQVWLIPFAFAQDVQVKLWYPLIMRAIPQRLRDVSCRPTGAIQIDIAFTFTFLHWSFSSNSTSGQLLRTIRLGLLEHRVVESCTPFLSASSIDRCNVYIHLTAPLHPSTFGTILPNNKYQRSWPHKGYAQPSTFTKVTSHLQMPSG